eukprot:11022750-Alexandrium_andersonii.AAC.1
MVYSGRKRCCPGAVVPVASLFQLLRGPGRNMDLGNIAVGLFSLPPTGHSVKMLLREVLQGASPGGLPPPRTP